MGRWQPVGLTEGHWARHQPLHHAFGAVPLPIGCVNREDFSSAYLLSVHCCSTVPSTGRLRAKSAVDHQFAAGAEGGAIPGQEYDRIGDVLRLTEMAERMHG